MLAIAAIALGVAPWNAAPPTQLPPADAGPDVTVGVNQTITITGSASGENPTSSWNFNVPTGSACLFNGGDSPDVSGTQVVVNCA